MAKNYDITILKKAIEDSGGQYQTIAERLGCEWHTAKSHVEKYEETKKAYANETESVLDLAESKLIENIKDNDNTAIIFYLKTKGKNRGYVERIENEHTGKNGEPLSTTPTIILQYEGKPIDLKT